MAEATLTEKQQALFQDRFEADLGGLIGEALKNPNIIEVVRNADGTIWAEEMGKGMYPIGAMEDNAVESLINVVASLVDASVTREKAILECELPFNACRFAAMIPPVVESPIFSIRKKAERIFSIEEYLEQGIIRAKQVDILKEWILQRKNILVVGGTGSGKTTLVNALIDLTVRLCPAHRLIILEDTLELQCKAKNSVVMRSNDHVSMQKLVKSTLRHRPDRIIVGEVRGKEALDLLKAWSTGHPGGVCTVHANSALESLTRIEFLVEEATQASMKKLIAQAINGIVYIEKTANGRRIKELLTVDGIKGDDYQLTSV